MGWGPGGVPQSHPGRLGSLLALLSRRKRRSWVPGNQPDRLPGCQHLRNAKPSLRQGWVLRAGCSAGDSAGPPRRGVQGAAPPVPLGTARHGTAQHGTPLATQLTRRDPRLAGTWGCRVGDPQAQGAAWAGPACGGAGGEGSFVVLGARERRCSHPGCHPWGLPGACTHAPTWWVLGWVPAPLGSAPARWAHRAGRWVRSLVLPLSPSVPEFGGLLGL